MRTLIERKPHRRLADDDGQAIVEAALVLPAMIFLILVIMQLTMVQHARIMTDYAAFCAARAGIVYNADKDAMERAATVALLPTIGRTDQIAPLGVTFGKAIAERAIRAAYQLPLVRVTVLNPKKAMVQDRNNSGHLNQRELDFDDIRPAAAKANVLQIQLDYLYRMRIPFANRILQTIFFAQKTNTMQLWRDRDLTQVGLGGTVARFAYAGQGGDAAGIMAASIVADADRTGIIGGYFFPLKATYSMRMQSNVYLNNAGQ